MAGIYIHIPFCRQACIYCNFHFSTSLGSIPRMTDAIGREMELRKEEVNSPIETIYLGGGTPGILEPQQLTQILSAVKRLFAVSSQAETTLEVNPEDINPLALRIWKEAGINRLSIGIQSFNEEELRWMNRSHSAHKSLQALQEVRDAGFNNFSTDLIFGSPLSRAEILEKNVETLLQFEVPHISCYALTSEPKTRLHKMIREKKSPSPDDDLQADQFLHIMERLRAAGYAHYEISNFARQGFRSQHNSSYWKGLPYWGFGPSAHSFDGKLTRSYNIPDNRHYIQSIEQGQRPAESEILTPSQQLNEAIMIGLRRSEGLDLKTVNDKFGEAQRSRILQAANIYLQSGVLSNQENFLILSDQGKLMADRIASDLFCDD